MKIVIALLASSMLIGCANSSWWASEDESEGKRNMAEPSAVKMNVVNITSDPDAPQFDQSSASKSAQASLYGAAPANALYGNGGGIQNGRMMTKHVGDYVQNMTQDLISNMEYLTDKTPVGVTTFALIDSDLQRTNLLGFQLSESFMHELHKFRIPVIDFKATEYIRVTEHGDFLLTRDFLELTETAPIEYILTGTLTKHQSGYLVNARILGLKSKAVVASAQMLMPFYVVDALLPSEHDLVDGVKLTQGE
ncbi:FlgO family outer membrane protein [Aliiglaciecola sp. LCG003]|uniref:FlgO family outer membrane protein n=1 Tax=Aliiglaciecola sp. LCG003 TaxID=3053655 RepID=UPI002572FD15|nr:FlgO family outer membrane protein [Aliiglaciecola sp. LCG003]WJG08300.1 FlgO family outer membrane protein [Aliiglaciecola sp. LCG003]